MSTSEIASAPKVSARSETYGKKSIFTMVLAGIGWSILIIFAVLEIFPFVFTVANSFKCLPAVQSYPRSILPLPPYGADCQEEVVIDGETKERQRPAEDVSGAVAFNPTLEGYQEVMDARLPRWLFNTAFFATSITLIRLLIDSMAGYALARLKFAGNRVIFYLMLATMMVPAIVMLIPRFIILKQLGLLGTYGGLIFPLAADAFGIFLMKQFFESIPTEIEEAGMVDGANRFTLFWRVVLPMATPALTALAIFSFQGTWNDFLMPLIVFSNSPDKWTLPVGLSSLRGAQGETLRWHMFLAGSVITTLPLAAIFFYFQRYFVEGISYTGVKG